MKITTYHSSKTKQAQKYQTEPKVFVHASSQNHQRNKTYGLAC